MEPPVVVGCGSVSRLARYLAEDVEIAAAHPSYRCTDGASPSPNPEVRMKYLLLIYADEHAWENTSPEGREAMYEEYGSLMRELTAKGQMLGGDELAPTSSATTVRIADGERLVTDGPFAETKEALGGYFLVDVDDLDAAIDIAVRIPAARHGSIEVRPLLDGP
jgi:hypothetical protein